jgi:cytochrome P450
MGAHSANAVAEIDLDLTDPALYRDGFPHELFVDLRRQGHVLRHATVPMARAPDGFGFWAILGHPEVQHASREWQSFSALDGPRIVPTVPQNRGHTLTSADPDAHTRLRKLVSAGFTPRMIARLEEQIGLRTKAILDDVAARGECDFVRDVAYALPMHIIADIVGMPDADRAWVFSKTDIVMRSGDPRAGISPEARADVERELFAYAQQLGEDKRRNPGDDVWSLLAVAEIDDESGARSRLTDVELDMFFLILSLAGSETTRNVISSGLRLLLDHDDEREQLRAAVAFPDTAVDELIRWTSPVTSFGRTMTHDADLGGQHLEAGDRVTMWFPSANFDERVFVDPFRFDPGRSPNRHVSFGGGGVHYCLGAHLARREVKAMFEQLLARFDQIELTAEPTWMAAGPDATVALSLDRMPVRVHSRA